MPIRVDVELTAAVVTFADETMAKSPARALTVKLLAESHSQVRSRSLQRLRHIRGSIQVHVAGYGQFALAVAGGILSWGEREVTINLGSSVRRHFRF